MHTRQNGVEFIDIVSLRSKSPDTNSAMMSLVDIVLFMRSDLLKANLIYSRLFMVMGFFLMMISSNVARLLGAVTFFLHSTPADFFRYCCGGYQDASVVRALSLSCVEAIFLVGPVAILLSASSLP